MKTTTNHADLRMVASLLGRPFSVTALAKDGTPLASMMTVARNASGAKMNAMRDLHDLADDDRFERFQVATA